MLYENIDRNKLFIISVDGLDVSGKETFCKNLKKVIRKELIEKSLLNVNIKSVSFPRYETNLGSDIKEILNQPIEKRDLNKLEGLFSLDRIEFFNTFFKEEYDDSKMNIIICDRYSYANFIYSHIPLMKEHDKPSMEEIYRKALEKLESEMTILPTPDVTIIFNRVSDISRSVHKSLLMEKSEKDKNETEDIQEFLSNIINTKLLDTLKKFSKRLMVVPIGSNFDSNQIEIGISTLITSKIIENNMDTIMYPSTVVYKNNETMNLINDLDFIPTVEIQFLIDKDKTDIDLFKQNIKQMITLKKGLDPVIDPSSLIDPGFIYFKDFNIFYNRLVMDYCEDIILKNLNEEQIDEYINKRVDKEILTPRKNSKLDCNYTIITPRNIVIPRKSVRAIDLGIEVKSIASISKKTDRKIIDLDIKTSKECILEFGVGVADSPSSVSSDYEGTLSIILINHTDEPAKIPFGFPIASLVVKDSSCETLFTLLEKE